MCIEFSEAEIGEAILGSDGNTLGPPSGDDGLLELVDQLLAREVAMWVFVYTITDIYEASEITDPVLTVVRTHLAEPVLSREQRIELHELCHRLAGLDVARLFMMSVDHVGYTMRSDPRNLCSVLNELEEFQTRESDGLHPIAVFVEYLASAQPPESARPLRAWVDAFVGTRTPHQNALRSIRSVDRAPAGPDRSEPQYCTIYIDVDGVDPGLWTVSIFFQEGSQPAVPLVPPDDNSYTEAQIRALIHDALNSRQFTGVRPADIRIEFFLPVFLVNLPVDRWRIGAAGVVLGLQYQVVIRCLTRFQDFGSAHADLLDK
jgi:vWA-MoxR associated protein C-terminal domain/vWA-MoxR associated protein middle region 0